MRAGPRRGRQGGIAVITAMLVVTIATVIAVAIAWQTNLDLRRTEGLLAWEQSRQFAYGAEAFAASILQESLDEGGANAPYTRGDDETACGGFSFTLDQGGMTGGICDLQGRFNLNNLVINGKPDNLAVAQYRRLVNAVAATTEGLELPPDVADTIVESTVDWIDPDESAEYNGAEDDAYTSEQPPYRAANFWFTSVSELRAVRGVTPEIYTALAPHLAALPVGGQRTLINVNTATIPVYMSLGDDMSEVNAEGYLELSRTKPFEDAADIRTEFTKYVDAAMFEYLGVNSRYFALRGLVSIGTAQLGMYSLLHATGTTVVPRLRQFDVVDQVPAPPEPDDDDESEQLSDADE